MIVAVTYILLPGSGHSTGHLLLWITAWHYEAYKWRHYIWPANCCPYCNVGTVYHMQNAVVLQHCSCSWSKL